MMCFKHLLPYALLLPISSASPIFILVFAIQVFYTVKPCGYCLVLISILFLSSSPSSPFTSFSPSSSSDTAQGDLKLITPKRKTWLDINHGYLFDPTIHAFSPNTTLEDDPSLIHHRPSADQGPLQGEGHVKPRIVKAVPSGYYDLRYKGLGFVLDLGWRRTEEGTRWEMEDRQIARGILDRRTRDRKNHADSDTSSHAKEEKASRNGEQVEMSDKPGQRAESGKSWTSKVWGVIRGKSRTNGMLGDW